MRSQHVTALGRRAKNSGGVACHLVPCSGIGEYRQALSSQVKAILVTATISRLTMAPTIRVHQR